uniref:Uncharacterized protein n=1 Tax=Fagus sylvatica TaxID=28930 RepID=A0A2N9GCW5_FAGSY
MGNLNIDKLPPFNLSEPPTKAVFGSGSPIKGLVAPLHKGWIMLKSNFFRVEGNESLDVKKDFSLVFKALLQRICWISLRFIPHEGEGKTRRRIRVDFFKE